MDEHMDWRAAERAIGTHDQDDYILDLASHRKRYEGLAPALVELMDYASTRSLAQTYHDYDQSAIEAQNNYRRWMSRANLGALLTATLSAAAMSWRILEPDLMSGSDIIARVDLVLSIGAVFAAALGTAGLYFLRSGQLLETWMRRRASAETLRIGYFESIVARAVERPAPVPILALEYFRRYQFNVQKAFFLTRARQHENSAKKSLQIGAAGAVIASLSSVFAVFPSGAESAAGAFAVFGAALGAFAIGREQMTQDRRNAERYLRTHAALVKLTDKLDEVREGVVAGRATAARELASAVNEQISNEHRQWLDEIQATEAAITRIEAALGARDRGRESEE
jgi:hypothetical protein